MEENIKLDSESANSSLNNNPISAPKRELSMPMAIVLAGILIAGAILLKGNSAPVAPTANTGDAKEDLASIKLRPISSDEHIFGNPNAKIVIVEYSDTECPFCKIFHATLHQVVDKYDGKVAWVYRHYPIPQLHPKAEHESQATECAWEQGGNDSFWKYTDELYTRTQSNNRLEVEELPKIAEAVGLNVSLFNACLESGKFKDKVQADIADGEKAGVNGTPSSFILKNGKVVDTIGGAEPLTMLTPKIDALLK